MPTVDVAQTTNELTEKIEKQKSRRRRIKSPKTVEENKSSQPKEWKKTGQVEKTIEEDRSSQQKLLN